MTNRLSDATTACRMIESIRREEREYARRTRKVKSITIPLEMIEGLQLSTHVAISHNSATGVVLMQSSSLVFYKHRIHPGTHGKDHATVKKHRRCLKIHEDIHEKVVVDVENEVYKTFKVLNQKVYKVWGLIVNYRRLTIYD